MNGCRASLALIFILAGKKLFESKLLVLIYWQKRKMTMWILLIEMHIKGNDVLLTPSVGSKAVHIRCPLLNILAASYATVVRTTLKVHLLVTESKLTHTLTTTTHNHIPHRSVVWLFHPLIRILDTTSL